MNIIDERLAQFNKEFVDNSNPNVEPVFTDPVGQVGPIRAFIQESMELMAKSVIEDAIIGMDGTPEYKQELLDKYLTPTDNK